MENIVLQDICVLEDQINKIREEIQKHRLVQEECVSLLKSQKETPDEYSDNINYYREFWRYYIFNELTIKKINEVAEQNSRLAELETNLDEFQIAVSSKQKKKNRRTASEIEKAFSCPYERCQKLYGSDVSLNLHIKLKHEGGNKTDREKIAKQIIQAEDKGEHVPELPIKFPPGYLEKFRDTCKQDNKEGKQRKNGKIRSAEEHTIFYDE